MKDFFEKNVEMIIAVVIIAITLFLAWMIMDVTSDLFKALGI